MKCVWDPKKNEINKKRHGLSFELAELVFDDPYAVTFDDYIDEQGDQRYQTITAYEGVLFQIGHLYVEIDGVETPRILSERQRTMSKKSTLSAAEIKRQLDYARSLKDEDIDKSDPDAHEIRKDQLASARPFHEMFRPVKKLFSFRIDADVLDYYQSTGEGYQTRMNAALRAQMKAEQQRATRNS